jgi:hypothetical protein
MPNFNGSLVFEPASLSAAGYTIELLYQRSVTLEGQPEVKVTELISAVAAASGEFVLAVPDDHVVDGQVRVRAKDPTGATVHEQELGLANLNGITIQLTAPQHAVIRPVDPGEKGLTRIITGHAVNESGQPLPTGVPVTIWGRLLGAAPTDDLVLLVATTLSHNGFFSLPWQSDRLEEGVAFVRDSDEIRIPLDENDRLPLRIVLVVENEFASRLTPDTALAKVTPRLPTEQDLTENSAVFSQDLGSECVQINRPNRVLEEFPYRFVVRVTEPQIRKLSQGGTPLTNVRALQRIVEYLRTVWTNSGGKAEEFDLTAEDLRGLEDKTLNDLLATLSVDSIKDDTQRLKIFKQLRQIIDLVRKGKGVPGRSVLNSFNAIDWDDTPTLHEAASVAVGHILHYRQVWRADGYSLGDLLYSLPLAPGQKRKIAILGWDREERATRREMLDEEEQLTAFLERDRDVLEVVGSNLREEINGSSSSKVWGGGGGIGAGFIGTGWGIFGGVAGGGGGAVTQSRQDASRQLSAQSMQQLRDRTSQRASSIRDLRSTVVQTLSQNEQVRAQTEVVANYNHCHALTVEYFEILRHFQVSHELVDVTECLFVPMPMTFFDAPKALRWRDALSSSLLDRSLLPAFDSAQRVADAWVGWDFPPNRYSELAPERLEGELRISFVLPRPRDTADGAIDPPAWFWISPLIATTLTELYNTVILPARQEERDRVFRLRVAPVIAEGLVNRLRFSIISTDGTRYDVPLDATLVSRYEEGTPLYVTLRPAGALPALPREQIAQFSIRYEGPELPEDAQVIVRSGRMRWVAELFNAMLFDEPRLLNDLGVGDDVTISTPVSRAESRNPHREDEDRVAQLLRHLNDNLEEYHCRLFADMDYARRFMLLDGVIVPNTGGLSVASLVENQVIGIVGNSLVMPVAPGFQLDPTLATDARRRAELLDLYATNPAPPLRVSLPTRGVFAEAVLGGCNCCETKDESLFWRWEESPIPDEPPALLPLSTDSRAVETGPITPTPFPRPLVQFQQVPEFPDPTGLRTALEILQRSDLFKDVTGLEQTQRNSLAAFEKALSVAKSFGGQAANLALQQENGRNIDRTLNQIEASRNGGSLTPSQASSLAYNALRSLAGQPQPQQETPLANPSVQQAVESASQASRAQVSVSTPAETVEASFDDTEAASAVGSATTIIRDRIIEEFVSMDIVHDELTPTFPVVYSTHAPYQTISELDTHLIADTRDPFIAANVIRQDPGDATKFQTRVRMLAVFPTTNTAPTQPEGRASYPLAVLVHGNHREYDFDDDPPPLRIVRHHESFQGYYYLQEELARRGIISVSIDCGFTNFTALNNLIETRALMILEALRLLRRKANTPGDPFRNRIDFDNIALMGHSRGGDAVARFAKMNTAVDVTTNADDKFGIKTICLLAPTDFTGGQVVASRTSLDETDVDFLSVVYGALDGDVTGSGGSDAIGGTGFRHYDRASCQKSLIFVERCCHNSFNSIWHGDGLEGDIDQADRTGASPRLIDETRHREIAKEYIGGQFEWWLKNVPARSTALSALFTGATPSATGLTTSVLWRFGPQLRLLENFEPMGPAGNTIALNGGMTVNELGIAVTGLPPTLKNNALQQTLVAHGDRSTGTPPVSVEVTLGAGQRDIFSFSRLAIDLGAFFDTTSAATITGTLPNFSVRLTDGSGATATATTSQFSPAYVRPFFHQLVGPVNVTGHHLQTLMVPLSAFAGVNLHDVTSIRVEVLSGGHIFIDDIKVATTH